MSDLKYINQLETIKTITAIITDMKGLPASDLADPNMPLIADGAGVLDSFDIMQLVHVLETVFKFEFADDEIIENNLNTVSQISDFILCKSKAPIRPAPKLKV